MTKHELSSVNIKMIMMNMQTWILSVRLMWKYLHLVLMRFKLSALHFGNVHLSVNLTKQVWIITRSFLLHFTFRYKERQHHCLKLPFLFLVDERWPTCLTYIILAHLLDLVKTKPFECIFPQWKLKTATVFK